VKTDEMLDIFLTPSNSPYLGGESISFCCRQFPSPSIGGRARDGGRGELREIIFTQAEDFRNEQKNKCLSEKILQRQTFEESLTNEFLR
jgi:hypothetical protein